MNVHPQSEKMSFTYPSSLRLVLFIVFFASVVIWTGCQNSDSVKAQLVSEVKSIQPGQTFCIALRLEMDKQWHTYWKNPGDSGMPTQIAWNLPDGFHAGEIQWPYPQKFQDNELVSFGYEEEVFLLTEIKVPDIVKPGARAEITAEVDWLACKESCIPGHADLKISLPVHDRKPESGRRWTGRFSDTRRNLPGIFTDWKISAAVKNDLILMHILPPSWFENKLTGLEFFPEQEGIIDLLGKQNLQKSEEGYVIEIQRSLLSGKLPSRLHGVLISEKGWNQSRIEHAMQIDVALHRFE